MVRLYIEKWSGYPDHFSYFFKFNVCFSTSKSVVEPMILHPSSSAVSDDFSSFDNPTDESFILNVSGLTNCHIDVSTVTIRPFFNPYTLPY